MKAPILYVDDDPANLVVFEAVLEGILPILTATSGQEALEIMRREEVAVLLTDQRMPGMSGVELAEKARAEFPCTMRMLITAYSDLNAAIDSINRGHVQQYLRKPWEPQELRLALENARERYLLGRRLREVETRLLATERVYALGVVAAGIAHEIRSPLGAVQANLDVSNLMVSELRRDMAALQPNEIDDRLRQVGEALDDCREAAETITEITRSIELSTRSTESGEVDLREVVALTARSVRGELQRRGFLDIEACAVPMVRGSRTQLGQVVLNLVVNALEALEPAQRRRNRISIRLWPEGAQVQLQVQDNGAGMAPETLQKAFDPFFTTKIEGGTGLGLAISKKIVEELGGNIEVDSKLGEGTRFLIRLPAIVS